MAADLLTLPIPPSFSDLIYKPRCTERPAFLALYATTSTKSRCLSTNCPVRAVNFVMPQELQYAGKGADAPEEIPSGHFDHCHQAPSMVRPGRAERITAFSRSDKARIPEVQSFVSIFRFLISERLQGSKFQHSIVGSVPGSMFIIRAMLLTFYIFRTSGKALTLSGVEASDAVLNMPRNAPVAHICTFPYRVLRLAERSSLSASECRR